MSSTAAGVAAPAAGAATYGKPAPRRLPKLVKWQVRGTQAVQRSRVHNNTHTQTALHMLDCAHALIASSPAGTCQQHWQGHVDTCRTAVIQPWHENPRVYTPAGDWLMVSALSRPLSATTCSGMRHRRTTAYATKKGQQQQQHVTQPAAAGGEQDDFEIGTPPT